VSTLDNVGDSAPACAVEAAPVSATVTSEVVTK